MILIKIVISDTAILAQSYEHFYSEVKWILIDFVTFQPTLIAFMMNKYPQKFFYEISLEFLSSLLVFEVRLLYLNLH